MRRIRVDSFAHFREVARALWVAGAPPAECDLIPARSAQSLLWEDVAPTVNGPAGPKAPRAFVERAETAALNSAQDRWSLLYRLLWRLTREQPALLSFSADPDVRRLEELVRAVQKDEHRMHAFVRFRRVELPDGERFVAWYRPEHQVLHRASEFFARRFATMRWSILTPDESAHWDLRSLSFGPGVPRDEAPDEDALVALFRTYYASTFNPARLNLPLMRAEMPSHLRADLPELKGLPELVASAPRRVRAMVSALDAPSPVDALLPGDRSLAALASAARGCTACPLHERATQTVFGAGPSDARAMLVGEQPGDLEDRQGLPFVGPAGALLNDVLADANVQRETLYVTNAVKHFNWTPSDRPNEKRRIHQRPAGKDIRICNTWLQAEIAAVRPAHVVCLGATAAQSLLGANFRISHSRGQVFQLPNVPWILATWHPSAILRAQDARAAVRMREELTRDLAELSRALARVA